MTQEELDAEEVLTRLQLGERSLPDWLMWQIERFMAEQGAAPTRVELPVWLYRKYIECIADRIRYARASDSLMRWKEHPAAVYFAGIPVVKGTRCLVS